MKAHSLGYVVIKVRNDVSDAWKERPELVAKQETKMEPRQQCSACSKSRPLLLFEAGVRRRRGFAPVKDVHPLAGPSTAVQQGLIRAAPAADAGGVLAIAVTVHAVAAGALPNKGPPATLAPAQAPAPAQICGGSERG